jgi:hypothetical protein
MFYTEMYVASLIEKFNRLEVKWEPVRLNKQDPPITAPMRATNWTIQDIKLSNLPIQNAQSSGNTLNLYMRKEAWRLYDALELFRESTKRTLWLSGPPGIGKSTLLFGWARYVATSQDVEFVWVHDSCETWLVTKMVGGSQASHTVISGKTDQAVSCLSLLCKDAKFVVLDAIRDKMKSLIFEVRRVNSHPESLCLVASTSYQGGGFSSEQNVQLKYIPYKMLSWTREEYDAGKNFLFPRLSIVEVQELYCYAGGSLRLMLKSDIGDIKSFLNEKLDCVMDPQALLSGLAGMSSPLYVNSLMQVLDSGRRASCPVSNYVTQQLIMRCGLSFVSTAKAHLRNNPSYQGWIFELEFLTKLKLANQNKMFNSVKLTFRCEPAEG